jgi:hypothetical protein
VFSLLALATVAIPSVGAGAPANPKVAIIVGPVGSSTDAYRADGDAAYEEALKYTSNVVKVYTPTATWDAAKAAMEGASIVIYLGHGNGFPSPYRTSPWPYSQNGLGLNPQAGTDDSTTQYYGEYYLANEVRLAPNAVVLLHHLCYASGNSESGQTPPTDAIARQRVDNMAAGWLGIGARAVIAEAHFAPAWYVNQLFTTHKTVDQVWRDAPTYGGNDFSFPSSRTPGATAQMDPDGTPNGYWRAATGWLDLTTDQVTGAGFAEPVGNAIPSPAVTDAMPSPAVIDLTTSSPVITWGTGIVLAARLGENGTGRPIELQATGDGVTWSTIAALTTDGSGQASLAYRPATSLFYRAVFAGAPDLGGATSPTVRTVVRQIAILRPTTGGKVRPIARNTSITFTATVRPARPELAPAMVRFLLYLRVGSAWQLQASQDVAIDGAGLASSVFTFATSGQWAVRAIANPTPYNANSVMSPLQRYSVR